MSKLLKSCSHFFYYNCCDKNHFVGPLSVYHLQKDSYKEAGCKGCYLEFKKENTKWKKEN